MTTSEGKAEQKYRHKYKLRFMPEALDEWHRLDGSVKVNLKKLLAKRLDHPHVPGGELQGPLAGCYKIKLRQQGARLIYSVEDDHLVVTVVAVGSDRPPHQPRRMAGLVQAQADRTGVAARQREDA